MDGIHDFWLLNGRLTTRPLSSSIQLSGVAGAVNVTSDVKSSNMTAVNAIYPSLVKSSMGGNARIEALPQNIVKQAYTSRVVQDKFFIPVNQRSAILICLLHFALGDSAMH